MTTPETAADRLRAYLKARDECEYTDDEIDYVVGNQPVHLMQSDLRAVLDELAAAREALKPFCFFDEDGGDTQAAWERIYREPCRYWINFQDIETARAALRGKG